MKIALIKGELTRETISENPKYDFGCSYNINPSMLASHPSKRIRSTEPPGDLGQPSGTGRGGAVVMVKARVSNILKPSLLWYRN